MKLALAHKGLAWESVPWRFTDKDVISFANSTTVPVLVDGTTFVADSWACAEYLDRQYPASPERPPLLPGPQGHALASLARHVVERQLHPVLLKALVLDIYRALHPKDQAYFRASREKRFGCTLEAHHQSADAAQLRAAVFAALTPLRALLQQQRFIHGEAPAWGDYCLMGAVMWARCISASEFSVLPASDPACHAWQARMLHVHGGVARGAACLATRASSATAAAQLSRDG